MRVLYAIAIILLVIGGLAWAFMGLFDVNILEMFGAESPLTLIIYLLLGLAAIVVAAGSVRMMSSGRDASRPQGAQPPEGGTPVKGRTPDRTKPGETPHKPESAKKKPTEPGTTGATGAGPGGTP